MFTLNIAFFPHFFQVLCFFFFFQAEDGIRDHCVTGVQTCALPISGSIAAAQGQAHEWARARTELLVRKRGKRYLKRQPCTVRIAACPVRVQYPTDVRGRRTSPKRTKAAWLVIVRVVDVDWEPWLLLTDWPVTDEASALEAFRMYRQRWAVEDCFKFTKAVLGWEDVQLLDLAAIRTLVALGWVAAGFLYELGVTLEWPEVQLLGRLGGWVARPDRPPGKTLLSRGLQRLLDHLATAAILRDEIARHGALPPRLAALLGSAAPSAPSLCTEVSPGRSGS